MKIVALPGSLRTGSSNVSFIRALVKLAPSQIEMTICEELGMLPLFSPDIDIAPPPKPVARLRSMIESADAVIICTPEYAYGMPGTLKNALDWLVSSAQLYKKPTAALSTSPSDRGGDRALAWLQQTLSALDAEVPRKASFPVPYIKTVLTEEEGIEDSRLINQIGEMFVELSSILNVA
ncbi:MAG: NADPH-dependent FMN reductase [Phormidesmis sp.]